MLLAGIGWWALSYVYAVGVELALEPGRAKVSVRVERGQFLVYYFDNVFPGRRSRRMYPLAGTVLPGTRISFTPAGRTRR